VLLSSVKTAAYIQARGAGVNKKFGCMRDSIIFFFNTSVTKNRDGFGCLR